MHEVIIAFAVLFRMRGWAHSAPVCKTSEVSESDARRVRKVTWLSLPSSTPIGILFNSSLRPSIEFLRRGLQLLPQDIGLFFSSCGTVNLHVVLVLRLFDLNCKNQFPAVLGRTYTSWIRATKSLKWERFRMHFGSLRAEST